MQANVEIELTKLNEESIAKATEAITTKRSTGTNTHAGLMAGKEMLDTDTSVSADRKYLVFVSDGIAYLYNKKPTATAWNFLQAAAGHIGRVQKTGS